MQLDRKQLDLFDRLDQLRSESLRLNHEQNAGQTRLVALAEQELQATGGVTGALDSLHDLARAQRELIAETGTVLGSALTGVRSDTEASATTLERLAAEVTDLRSAGAGALLVGAAVDDLDEGTARLLDYAESHTGFAAQCSLWFNPPVALGYRRGSVVVAGVNERVVEVPFVYRALSRIPPGSTIVDVGASESTVSLSLASLGYRVTAVDPRPYGLRHPNLEVIARAAEEWEETRTFDAIVCLSTVEHIGLGAYGEPRKSGRPDHDLMRRLRRLARPGTLLVFSTRFGRPATGWLERTYDAAAIDDLLEGWEIEESAIAHRLDDATWSVVEELDATLEGEAVFMAVARLAAP
jgi:2-polyprenyl-3-methyl-5-hydroxy-6-metoxy-1,4-benzoquinol methylase